VCAPVTQRIHLLQFLPYPSNQTIHSICYRRKERVANGKREFEEGKEKKRKSSRIIKSGKS
jgi:predicted nucleic acid-binding OB-fold protein